MSLFSDVLGSEQTLFSNPDALDPDFVPKLLPHREDQQFEVANAIKPLFHDRTGKNVLVKGTPGIGKTAAVKRVLMDLEEETDDITYSFVNCWQKNTTFKAITQIVHDFGFKFTQNMNTDDVVEVLKKISSKKKGLVFVFDEIDKADDYDFLYLVLENIPKKSIILITSDLSWGKNLDKRIASRLVPSVIEFPQYNFAETEDILKQRVKYTFYQNVWDSEAFSLVAAKSAELKDLRMGIMLLKAAGNNAEAAAESKILLSHAKKAIEQIDEFEYKTSKDLTDEEKLVLNVCQQNSGETFSTVYAAYKDAGGDKSEKTFKRKLDSLEKKKKIKYEKAEGVQGSATNIVVL